MSRKNKDKDSTKRWHKRRLLIVFVAFALIAPIAALSSTSLFTHAYSGPASGNYPDGETARTFQGPVPRAECGSGSRPEPALQGEVPVKDRDSDRSSLGYECNMELVGRYGPKDPQGFEGAEWQFARYGHCAYYSQRLAGAGMPPFVHGASEKQRERMHGLIQQRRGAIVLDVSRPEDPKFSTNLTTPGMLDPWESLKVNHKRGLLAAVNVKDGQGGGLFEVYDLKQDCAHPKLLSSTAMESIVNHEGNFAADGMTYYSGGLTPGVITAIDVSDPTNPHRLKTFWAHMSTHGMSTSPDGNRLYLSHINHDYGYTHPHSGSGGRQSATGGNGIGIYDVSEIQQRKPNPSVHLVSALNWEDGQIGQHTLSIFKGKNKHPYAIHVDEAGHGGARIIDVRNEKKPEVISKVKTDIMMPWHRDRAESEVHRPPKESGGMLWFGYNFHYCNVDKPQDPAMLACSAFNQGVRVFDIRDLHHPKEIAYFNPGGDGTLQPGSFGGTYSGYPAAMPQFVPSRQELWFTDQDRGMYTVRFTNGTWISHATEKNTSHGN